MELLKNYTEFEKITNYTFKNKNILDKSLRHSSYVNEQSDVNLDDNERLEFLGDAVLNLVVGDILMKRFPLLKEGDLSRMRSNLVNETQLAIIAREINLGAVIKLGKGEEQTNGREKNSILSDVFEAVIAAIYVDGGFDAAFKFIETLFSNHIDNSNNPSLNHDFKSRLQELSQTQFKVIPKYKVVHESGPDHNKTFKVQLTIINLEVFGSGKSKKAAEQAAAEKAVNALQEIIKS